MTSLTKTVLIVVATGVALLTGICIWFPWEAFTVVPSSVTDVSRYQKIFKSFPIAGLTDHFPRTIPAEAKNVRMDYYPGFMQGGGNFQLKVTLPPEEVKQIFNEYDKKAIRRFSSKEGIRDIHDSNFVPIPAFYTGDTGDRRFPVFDVSQKWDS